MAVSTFLCLHWQHSPQLSLSGVTSIAFTVLGRLSKEKPIKIYLTALSSNLFLNKCQDLAFTLQTYT
jgi:hypothetical protein